jgi:SAM-dependent methyltransferase
MCVDVADNPWLAIPAADYEGHMGAAGVDQLAPLRAIFADVYARVRPLRMALLGCGTGNGVDVVDARVTTHFIGVDLNPEYLAVARARHPQLAHVANWGCARVEDCEIERASLDLIHAALLFEYVEPAQVLPRIAGWLAPGGVLSVVLQLPGGDATISDTGFASLRALSGLLRLVSPDDLSRLAAGTGLTELTAATVPITRGKSLWTATFVRPAR